jgi:predicted O-methyltransferase YrrM
MSNRYDQLVHIIDLIKPRTIVEVGTQAGYSAVKMIQQAMKYRKSIQYVGYDLFEDATPETDEAELNIKPHHTVEQVEGFIKSKCPGAEVHLIKGNTRQTLKPISADLCFIDGGHSIETIANDYEKCKGSTVIVLDDYYSPDKDGKEPDTELYGCNKLVSDLPNALVLPVRNEVRTGGAVQMVLVLGET